MTIDDLAKSIRPWVQVDTWHTTHPLDTERFNKAVGAAISEHGSQITYDDFKEAMESLVEELYSGKYEDSYIEEVIERCASSAETITSYVRDTE